MTANSLFHLPGYSMTAYVIYHNGSYYIVERTGFSPLIHILFAMAEHVATIEYHNPGLLQHLAVREAYKHHRRLLTGKPPTETELSTGCEKPKPG